MAVRTYHQLHGSPTQRGTDKQERCQHVEDVQPLSVPPILVDFPRIIRLVQRRGRSIRWCFHLNYINIVGAFTTVATRDGNSNAVVFILIRHPKTVSCFPIQLLQPLDIVIDDGCPNYLSFLLLRFFLLCERPMSEEIPHMVVFRRVHLQVFSSRRSGSRLHLQPTMEQ